MTIEQKAEEYGLQKAMWCESNSTDLKEAYIDGATENGIQWHDLRKDPNDLPKDEELVLNNRGHIVYYDTLVKRWYSKFLGTQEGVIAWCEIPVFNEGDKE